uniref:F-box domain-containing protein n=1 Tax=Chloropicon laureae TaxID=464258 RepID=A0A7S3E4U6_9CHLO|mmetsp:Transcript_599/g.1453  ORF Transcript_599/g.1453 Transcript_599/m.1453 type:complete len:142 (+) Transcript_599:178-603(+)
MKKGGGQSGSTTQKAIIVHPTLGRRLFNEAHEQAKRDTPRIPLDVVAIVVGHLDCAKTVASFARVSKRCRDFAEDDALWRRLYSMRFPMPSEPPKGKWKDLYRFQKQFLRDVLLNKNLDEILERAYPRWESVGAIALPVAT